MVNADANPNGELLVIAVWILWAICTITLLLRYYVRWRLRALWWDDGVLLLSYLPFTAYAVMTQLLVDVGYGSWSISLDMKTLKLLDALVRFVGIDILIAITLSKLAFGFTLIKILAYDNWRRFVIALSVSLVLVTIPPIPLVFLQCQPIPIQKNDPNISHCFTEPVITYYIVAFSAWQAIVDIAFALIAIKTLSGLTIRTLDKIGVMVAMSLGISSGVMAIIKAIYGVQLATGIDNRKVVDMTIIGTAEVVSAVVAASMPILRVLYRKGFGLHERRTTSTNTCGDHPVTIGSDDRRPNASYIMRDPGDLLLAAVTTDVESRASSQGDKESQFSPTTAEMKV